MKFSITSLVFPIYDIDKLLTKPYKKNRKKRDGPATEGNKKFFIV
ncbi:MAG: hypothetical protein SVZ03_01985 [Spirochaetota bacterium]|nr:hypothetical protein [Spirochaetota bacterium]